MKRESEPIFTDGQCRNIGLKAVPTGAKRGRKLMLVMITCPNVAIPSTKLCAEHTKLPAEEQGEK